MKITLKFNKIAARNHLVESCVPLQVLKIGAPVDQAHFPQLGKMDEYLDFLG